MITLKTQFLLLGKEKFCFDFGARSTWETNAMASMVQYDGTESDNLNTHTHKLHSIIWKGKICRLLKKNSLHLYKGWNSLTLWKVFWGKEKSNKES